MDTIATLSYATICMDKFENTYTCPEINNFTFHERYTDDIFIIYISEETQLDNFKTNLNMMHDSIIFDYDKSSHSVTFLDALILTRIDNYNQYCIQNPLTYTITSITDLLTPNISKTYFLCSQATRLRRIYTDYNELKKNKGKNLYIYIKQETFL